jgi:hypothetical protein
MTLFLFTSLNFKSDIVAHLNYHRVSNLTFFLCAQNAMEVIKNYHLEKNYKII